MGASSSGYDSGNQNLCRVVMEWYEVSSAFLLGLLGGLHCVGMCGPIVLWLPKPFQYFLRYGLGKTLAYSLMGFVLGVVGFSVKWAGFQQYFSLVLGIIIMFVFLGYQWKVPNVWKKAVQGRLQRPLQNLHPFWIGFWSGFLPCGLVYTALTAAWIVGSPASSSLFMAIFGIATLPALFLLHRFSVKIKSYINPYALRLQSFALLFMATLLIIRGLNLGIPYLSPKQLPNGKMGACCSKKALVQP